MKDCQNGRNRIEVTHPNLRALDAFPQRVVTSDCEMRQAVLATLSLLHGPAEMASHKLVPVADAEYGNAGAEDFRIDVGAAGFAYTGGPPGDDDAFTRPQLAYRSVAWLHV